MLVLTFSTKWVYQSASISFVWIAVLSHFILLMIGDLHYLLGFGPKENNLALWSPKWENVSIQTSVYIMSSSLFADLVLVSSLLTLNMFHTFFFQTVRRFNL